jgi:catechol 2,3-dioxygenase-like lactoylglutathione lyase family enzyme
LLSGSAARLERGRGQSLGLEVDNDVVGCDPPGEAKQMLNDAKIIAFVATTDPTKSRAFYEGVLGLAPTLDDEFAIVLDANDMELRIQKVQTLTPQPHTQLGWSVISLEEVVRVLHAKGVVFESYPFMQQNALGIWTAPSGAKVAWFKDPDGNLLSLTQHRG